MAGENEEEVATLETTPTWAVATVCFILIAVSILIEHALHLLAKYFNKKRRKALIQALDKIKSELMLLGFISLLLTVCEKPIANICIPRSSGEIFLPCQSMSTDSEEESKCEEQGKISLISRAGVQQLQLLIFALAIFHVFSCFLTFSLGMAKMKRWESWEAETRTFEYQFSNDPRRFQLIHQTSFGKRHLKFWSEHRFLRLPACFLRQFYQSVYKVDYVTLRHGFIMAHFAEGSNFDFQKYLRRALEKDFGLVVGISPWIWLFSILFIFFNARVFHNYLWLPFIPLVMLLVVGTKLQSIIPKMCLDSNDKSLVVRGTLLVRPSDHFKVLMPQLELLTDQQLVNVCNLRHSCQQAEDALTQGMDKLQQILAQSITADTSTGSGSYSSEMGAAMEKLDALEGFVNQNLINMFLDESTASEVPSDQSRTTDDNSEIGSIEDKDSVGTVGNSDFLKTWVVDSLPIVLRHLKIDPEARFQVQKEVLKFLAVQGLFSSSLGTEVTSFELHEKFRWPKAATSSALCRMCIEQLQQLLANAQKGEGPHAVASGLEANNRASYFMRFLSTLGNIPSVSLFRAISNDDEKAFKKLQAVETQLSRELNNLELAVNLAKRGNLPGAENMVNIMIFYTQC